MQTKNPAKRGIFYFSFISRKDIDNKEKKLYNYCITYKENDGMKKNKLLYKAPLLISLVALLLITTLIAASGTSTDQTIDFILEVPSTAITNGQTFSVLFKITNPNLEGFNLAGFQAKIKFDESLFTVNKVTDLSGNDTISQYTISDSTVSYICVNDFLTSTEGYDYFSEIIEIELTAKQNITNVAKKIAPSDFSLLLGNNDSVEITSFTLAIVNDGELPEVVKGDANGDGKVTTDDAVYLLYNTVYGNGSYPVSQPCDFDGSGRINGDDAIYLLYHVIFGETYPLN